MTRLLYAGKHTCPEVYAGKPFTLSLTEKVIRFNDYDDIHGQTSMLVYAVPMINIFAPHYQTGRSNDQQPYEMLAWTASEAWFDTTTGDWNFSRVHIQTWDRETFNLWAKWPHRRHNNRFWPIEFTAELAIFTLTTASRRRLLNVMDSIKKQQEHSNA